MPSLVLLSGPLTGRRYEIENEVTLGRSPSCDVLIQDTKVSRRHAKIVVRQETTKVLDLGSRNGTLLNGERIYHEARLVPGDRIQLGDTSALFEASASPDQVQRFAPPNLEHSPSGAERAIYNLALALLRANSEAFILRRAVEESKRALSADRAAVMLAGASEMDPSDLFIMTTMDRREVTLVGQSLYAPLVSSNGNVVGVLHLEHSKGFTAEQGALAADMCHLIGEALASVRRRTQGLPAPVKKLAELVAQVERKAILEALTRAKGRKIRAAAMLGISRPTLDKKIAAYHLIVER